MLLARLIVFLGASTVVFSLLHGLRPQQFRRNAFLRRFSRNFPVTPKVSGKDWVHQQGSPSALHSNLNGLGFFKTIGNTMQALVREISGTEQQESVDIPTQTKEVIADTEALQLLPSNLEAEVDDDATSITKPDDRDFSDVVVNVSRLKVSKKTALGDYSGAMRDNLWHGQGKLIGNPALGHHLEGQFYQGDLVSGEGAVALRTGTLLEGTWVEGILHGPGKIVSPLGHVQEGVFERGVLHASDTITYTTDMASSNRARVGQSGKAVRKSTKIATPLLESKKPRKRTKKTASEVTINSEGLQIVFV